MTARIHRRTRSGFIMMFTLIAVALTGLIMVETAPDFSNYAVLAKGQEFDSNLETIRRLTSSNAFCITTCDNLGAGPATPGIITAEDLLACFQQFVVSDGDTISSRETVITTIPRDPFVPARHWLSNSPQSKFWAVAYNTVSNPSFYRGTRKEAYLDKSYKLYYVRDFTDLGNLSHRIYRTDRFGISHEQVCYQSTQAKIQQCDMSHDGTSIAFSSDQMRFTFQEDIFTVGTNYFIPRAVTNSDNIVAPNVASNFYGPRWSADGGYLGFARQEQIAPFKCDLVLSPPMKINQALPWSHGATAVTTDSPGNFKFIGGISWSPPSQEKGWRNKSRYCAFIGQPSGAGINAELYIYDIKNERNVFPLGFSPYKTHFDTLAADHDLKVVTPVWLETGEGLAILIVAPNANRSLQIIYNPGRWPSPVTSITPLETGIWRVQNMMVQPGETAATGSTNWLIFENQLTGAICKNRIEPCKNPLVAANSKTPRIVHSTPAVKKGTLAVSQRGTRLAFVSAVDDTKAYTLGSDGSNLRLTVDCPEPILEVFFSTVETSWQGMPPDGSAQFPHAKVISTDDSRSRAYFDANTWRQFLNDNTDFPGDFKFGNRWLRLQPPENQNEFLFDDGWLIWRIDANDPRRTVTGTSVFMGKIDPCWGWQGGSYIAKEAWDPTGAEPADMFKQAFKAATTVIVGKGYGPTISPDDDEYCYSARVSEVSTYPPDPTTFPIDDLDLFVANTGGAPEPPPRNITPHTPESFECEPDYAPSGDYIYYTRQQQFYSPFLASHASSICRVTPYGGMAAVVQECGSVQAEWRIGWNSQLEFYHPSVSPDGTRIAFVAKERLLAVNPPLIHTEGTSEFSIGDIITECVYVKDVLFKAEPVLLLRIVNDEPEFAIGAISGAAPNSYYPVTGATLKDYSIMALTWSPDGEEIFATLTSPMNKKFPKRINERGSADYDFIGDPRYYDMADEQMVLALPCSISHFVIGTNSQEFPSGVLDPPCDDTHYRVVVRSDPAAPYTTATDPLMPDWAQHSATRKMIFNTAHSRGAFCYQRVATDSPFFGSNGFSLDTWYVLSGYVRSSIAVEDLHSAQLMVQLFNSRGTLVALAPPSQGKVYQIGYPDVGGTEWTRFSAAIMFDGSTLQVDLKDTAPYYVNLMLYCTGPHGCWAEFTGLKLERAFNDEERYLRPTRFSPGWIVFSSSLEPDPCAPGFLLFER